MTSQIQEQVTKQSTTKSWNEGGESNAPLFRGNVIMSEKHLEELVSKEVYKKLLDFEKQIKSLKNQIKQLNKDLAKECEVSDSEAKELLIKAINEFKLEGMREIDVIDLHGKTKLSPPQINRIMVKLEKDGGVTKLE